jgi:AAA family ATP:ADP antiporter
MAKGAKLERMLGRAVDVRPGEGRALLLAFGYFFFVLATYYVLRPVRDEMGVRSGVRNLPWLFTGTFLVSLAIAPLYAGLVARLERRRFIPLIYGFLTLNILAFWALLTANVATGALAMTFFVWLSVFNVFAVSVFWSFMADLFASEQAKRLYPTIAAGGSRGGFAGSATVTGLARLVGPANLLMIAAVLLVLALACAMALDRAARRGEGVAAPAAKQKAEEGERRVGGGWLEGLVVIFRSPYLGGVAIWVFALSLANTFAYNMQADIVGRSGLDSGARTQIFGAVDLAANLLQPIVQILVTRLVMQRLGVGVALSVITVVFCAGFLALGASPVLSVLIAFMIAQRTAQFAVSNPAREALFTVVSREDKYKAKNVIDNAVFRGADMGNAWLFNLLHSGMGFGLSTVAFIGAPIAAAWFALSLGLGRAQARRTADQQAALAAARSPHPQPAGA